MLSRMAATVYTQNEFDLILPPKHQHLNRKSNDLRRTVRKGRHHELKPLSSSFPVSSPSMSFLAIFLLGEERDLKIDRLYVVIILAMERGE
jgi:hypothetical protein